MYILLFIDQNIISQEILLLFVILPIYVWPSVEEKDMCFFMVKGNVLICYFEDLKCFQDKNVR